LSDQNYEALLKALTPKKYQTADFDTLYQIQAQIKFIEIVVEDIRFWEFEDYLSHQMLVENNIREIGSAIANLSPALRERNPHTDWKTLDIIRDLAAQDAAQDKGTIDPAILWDFGTKKLPVVRGQILQMIDDEYALLE
jgi:uncharacterized protein with HEPN domain